MLRLPRIMYGAVPLFLAVVLLSAYVPYIDIMERKQKKVEQQKERQTEGVMAQDIRRLSQKIERQATETDNKQDADALKDVAMDLDKLAKDMELGKIDRKEAAVKLSDLQEKVSERQEVMKNQMKNLEQFSRTMNQKFTRDLAKALADADKKGAQEALKNLAELMKNQNLTEADKERLKNELMKMAEEAKSINPELAQKLAQLAQSIDAGDLEAALAQRDAISGEMLKMADAMEQLKLMGSLEDDLEARKRAMLADLSVLYGSGGRDKEGAGMRGEGIGRGGDAPFDENAQVQFEDSKIKGEKSKGKIINEMFFKGQPFTSDAIEEYKDVYVESRQNAEDTLSREVIPAGYRKFVKGYFDAINPEQMNGR